MTTSKMFLKSIRFEAPDYDLLPLSKFAPADPCDVYLEIEIEVGALGDEGTIRYRACVATPEALKKRPPRRDEVHLGEARPHCYVALRWRRA